MKPDGLIEAATCDWNGFPIHAVVIDGEVRWDVIDVICAIAYYGLSEAEVREAINRALDEDEPCWIMACTGPDSFAAAEEETVVRMLSAASNPEAGKFLRWMMTMTGRVKDRTAAEGCEYLEMYRTADYKALLRQVLRELGYLQAAG